jgi:acyl-CoA synthetase (AMP-forming)/AMP-acid ligase II
MNEYSNIVEILQQHAIERPQKTVFTWLEDGETKTVNLTYRELDRQAKAIALSLRESISPGDRALLVYPYHRGLEFITAFFGCLYAGVIAVPCHPPMNRLTTEELQSRLVAAEAKIILTESSLLTKLSSQLSATNWLNTEKINRQEIERWNQPELTSDSIAFLQYTSGSTGEAKGVIVTHDCLIQNQQMLQLAFGHSQETIGVGWLPLFHDMGLIGNVIQVIYLGATCILMSPINFVQKPLRWLQAISQYKATTSGAPNFAYDLLSDRITDKQLAQLDLSNWQVAFCGAEPVRIETIDRFSKKFAPCGFRPEAFYPCYGMAEATLMITGGSHRKFPTVKYLEKKALTENRVVISDKNNLEATSLVSAGYPWLDGKIAIAHHQSLTECAPNRVGEIWFSASSVGKGYWQLLELTAQTFQAYLPNYEKPFLRTGDLGFIEDGELYITGRLNDVLVFWGLNHYPQQIEQTVAKSHPALKPNCGAAFAVTVAGQDRLVIVQEIQRSHRKSYLFSEIVEAIRWEIFQQHFIDVYAIALLSPGHLPKTSSGKVRRNECKLQFLNNSLETIDCWYLPNPESSNVTSLIQRYTNPLTYLKILSSIALGKIKSSLSRLKPNT